MSIVKRSIKSIIRSAGYRLTRYQPDRVLANEFPEMEAWEKVAIETTRPYTLTSIERQWALISALKYVHKKSIPGDIVECGVWKGGNLILAGLVGQKLGSRWKIWGYDTYKGMSEPTELDKENYDGQPAEKEFTKLKRDGFNAWCYSPLEEVSSNIKRCGLDLSNYRFIKGKCEETLTRAENVPDKVAILRLDTDWYESTKQELEVLFPRLEQHGVLIIDDYGHWSGAKKAVDEYFKNQPILLNRVDYTCRMALKL